MSYLTGDQLYQQRARQVLPILVRQADAKRPITYGDLGQEIGVYWRILNHSLGEIGRAMGELTERFEHTVPQIQSLVINKTTGLPGHGFDGFLTERGYEDLDANEKRRFLDVYWSDIYAYPRWSDVLESCDLQRVQIGADRVLERAARRRGGEGPEHAKLKEAIRDKPELAGLPGHLGKGDTEFRLPSGDSLDVLFAAPTCWFVIEVKPAAADAADIGRGLFQCVKYKAVIAALMAYRQQAVEVDVRLALGGELPPDLVPLRNSLGIKVVQSVEAR